MDLQYGQDVENIPIVLRNMAAVVLSVLIRFIRGGFHAESFRGATEARSSATPPPGTICFDINDFPLNPSLCAPPCRP